MRIGFDGVGLSYVGRQRSAPNGDNVANFALRWAREEACQPDALVPIVATYDIRSRQELAGTGYRAYLFAAATPENQGERS
jgi:hypothetical protein